jgi:hypothetical protein
MRFKNQVGSKAGVNRDTACNGMGFVACPTCRKGLVGCKECDKGSIKGCPACGIGGYTFCVICATGGYLALESGGRLLMEAREFDRAAVFFRAARERASQNIGGALRLPAGFTRDNERTWEVVLRNVGDVIPREMVESGKGDLAAFREVVEARLQEQLEAATAAASASK